jgi:hypothetical protein
VGNVVSIVTGYRLVRGSKPVGGEIFCTCSDRPWGPSSLLYNGYRVFSGGKNRPGRDADSSPPSSAVGHERVELYLYSPYRPYVLYRASVPVQGCTLPLLILKLNAKFNVSHTYALDRAATGRGRVKPHSRENLQFLYNIFINAGFKYSKLHNPEKLNIRLCRYFVFSICQQ